MPCRHLTLAYCIVQVSCRLDEARGEYMMWNRLDNAPVCPAETSLYEHHGSGTLPIGADLPDFDKKT